MTSAPPHSFIFLFIAKLLIIFTMAGSTQTLVISVLQLARYSTEGLLQLGPLGSTTFLPDTKCLVDDGRGRTPRLKKCDAVSRISQRLWDFTQVKRAHMRQMFKNITHIHILTIYVYIFRTCASVTQCYTQPCNLHHLLLIFLSSKVTRNQTFRGMHINFHCTTSLLSTFFFFTSSIRPLQPQALTHQVETLPSRNTLLKISPVRAVKFKI